MEQNRRKLKGERIPSRSRSPSEADGRENIEQKTDTLMDSSQHADKGRRAVYLVLIVMTLVFVILNIIQITFIYQLNEFWWTAAVPAGVFAAFLLLLAYEIYKHWHSIVQSERTPECESAHNLHVATRL